MSRPAVESQAWSRRRWWSVVLTLFALQVGLLCWFGARGTVQRRLVSPAPRLQLVSPAAGELLALNDPTLFVHGHPQSFAGVDWMPIPAPKYEPPTWSEPPRWLSLDAQQLGADFRRFVQTNRPFAFSFSGKPEAALAVPHLGDLVPATAHPSVVRVEGPLAARRWLNPPVLQGWEHSELLTNSIVQVLVNGDGFVVSQVLLGTSGLPQADSAALESARLAQFEPLPLAGERETSMASMELGALIFEWQTLPLSPTNAPPAKP